MANRAPFRFLVAAVSRQQSQRRQGHWKRTPADQQSIDRSIEDSCQHLTSKQYLFGSTVPPIEDEAWASNRHQGHGRQAGPLGLPNAARSEEHTSELQSQSNLV